MERPEIENKLVGLLVDELGIDETDRIKPQLVTNQVIRSIEPDHAQCINKIRWGSMITPGESLLIMEAVPAAYIASTVCRKSTGRDHCASARRCTSAGSAGEGSPSPEERSRLTAALR